MGKEMMQRDGMDTRQGGQLIPCSHTIASCPPRKGKGLTNPDKNRIQQNTPRKGAGGL